MRRALALLLAFGTLSLGTVSLGTACTPAPQDTTTVLHIGGMVCESCSQAITAALGKRDGVHAVTVDHVTGEAVIRHDAARIDRAALVAAVTALGYTVAP